MPSERTEVTELATALGVIGALAEPAAVTSLDELADRLGSLMAAPGPPPALVNVDGDAWSRLQEAWVSRRWHADFLAAATNGAALAVADDGLRHRPPRRVEWMGPQRPPGDDTVPVDLRIDHVYLVSCKYLSKVLSNCGPPRLFDRLLAGEGRSGVHWFAETAPAEYLAFYRAARQATGLVGLAEDPDTLERDDQRRLRTALEGRLLPEELAAPWTRLCAAVSSASAERWSAAMARPRDRLLLLWRLLRISSVSYFVLGTQPAQGRRPPGNLRLRVDAAWDWSQAFELVSLEVTARTAGQPEVGWRAEVVERASGRQRIVDGHVEVRWSHGRFVGAPEAKVYLDTPHTEVPGYHPLT